MAHTRLIDLDINEISLVKAGDDPEAKIIMTKMQKETPAKTENGKQYPAEAFAYAPDPENPSTWKLRLWENPQDKVTPAQVGRAVAALGPGYRGQKVQIPADALDEVKRKVASAYLDVNPDKELPSILKKGTNEMEYTREQLIGMSAEDLADLVLDMQEKIMGGDGMGDDMQKSLKEKDAEVKKALDEKDELKKELDEKDEMIKSINARIENMEKESVKKEMTAKATGYIVQGKTQEEITADLIKAHENGVLDMVERAFEASTTAAKSNYMLKEKGAPGDAEGASKMDKARAMSAEIRKENPQLSEQQAFAKAWEIVKKG